MSAEADDEPTAIPLPRETTKLYGHRDAETALLEAYRSGRIPHAWLIGGAPGIGKATLAYRMARFVLAHSDPVSADVRDAKSLGVSADHPTARQIAAGTHGGLLTLERTANEKGVLRNVITVDESRDTIGFFGSTAAVEGWRVCVVDTVEDLNQNAANALLKVLEEPPSKALFLLVSHAPARVLATIQSRCRKLPLRPLDTNDVAGAAALAASLDPSDSTLQDAAALSEGSVSRALALLQGNAMSLQEQTLKLLEGLPNLDHRALHSLGDALGLNDRVSLLAFVDTIERWLTNRLHAKDTAANLSHLARLAEAWAKINSSAREVESFNLERKPLVFSVFGMLAEATR